MKVFEEIVNKTASVATKAATKVVKNVASEKMTVNTKKIVIAAVASAFVFTACALLVVITGKLIPVRTNVHIYVH